MGHVRVTFGLMSNSCMCQFSTGVMQFLLEITLWSAGEFIHLIMGESLVETGFGKCHFSGYSSTGTIYTSRE